MVVVASTIFINAFHRIETIVVRTAFLELIMCWHASCAVPVGLIALYFQAIAHAELRRLRAAARAI